MRTRTHSTHHIAHIHAPIYACAAAAAVAAGSAACTAGGIGGADASRNSRMLCTASGLQSRRTPPTDRLVLSTQARETNLPAIRERRGGVSGEHVR